MSDGQIGLLFETRADQIFARFRRFHKANPHVWRLFVTIADKMRARGDRGSVAIVAEMIRAQPVYTETEEPVKLNNDYRAYYARMYMIHRDCPGFFRIRIRKSATCAAYATDLSAAIDPAPVHETDLESRLRELLDA